MRTLMLPRNGWTVIVAAAPFHSLSSVGWQPMPLAISTALFWPFKSSSTARTFNSLAIWDLFIYFQHSRKQSCRLFPLRGSVQMMSYLWTNQVFLKNFGDHVEK